MSHNRVNDINAFIEKHFPQREIYLRQGAEVSYHTITTRLQLTLFCVGLLIALWTIVSVFKTVLALSPIGSSNDPVMQVKADYERRLEDAESRYEFTKTQMSEQQANFEQAVLGFHEKYAAVAQFINTPDQNEGTDFIDMSVLSTGQVMMSALAREEFDREARYDVVEQVEFERQTGIGDTYKNLDSTQTTDIAYLEPEILANISLYRNIIERTDLSVESVLSAAPNGSGGPLIDISSTNSVTVGQPRLMGLRARVSEKQRLESALQSMPLAHPVNAENFITSKFGRRTDPFTRRPAMHGGLDIASYRNAPIVATADGVVKFAGRKGTYGRIVEVDHGYGFVTRYAHMAKTSVKRGQKVKMGDTVGLMGSTGRSTSTHLHYEVEFEGRHLDPHNFIKAGQYVQ